MIGMSEGINAEVAVARSTKFMTRKPSREAVGGAFHVAAQGVRHNSHAKAGRMPAAPAEPKVLRSFAFVAGPVGEVVGASGKEGAAEADPMGGDDGSLADAGIGGFQPAAWPPAGGVEAKGVSFRWSVFDVFIKRL